MLRLLSERDAVTGPIDDWESEYGTGRPNHEWFEQYLAEVEQAAAEPTPVEEAEQ